MLITVCDLLEDRRSDVERSGGEVVRIWDGLMDVQFKEHRIRASQQGHLCITPNDGGARFRAHDVEYSRVYIQ